MSFSWFFLCRSSFLVVKLVFSRSTFSNSAFRVSLSVLRRGSFSCDFSFRISSSRILFSLQNESSKTQQRPLFPYQKRANFLTMQKICLSYLMIYISEKYNKLRQRGPLRCNAKIKCNTGGSFYRRG